jgi:hypothetical protein
MALARKGLRTIQVDGESFVWRVRKKTSHEERHDSQLGIPIQHVNGGQLLVAYVGYSRSRSHGYYGTYSIKNITPLLIENAIINAIKLGWRYKNPGKPVSVFGRELVEDTRGTRPQAELEPVSGTNVS